MCERHLQGIVCCLPWPAGDWSDIAVPCYLSMHVNRPMPGHPRTSMLQHHMPERTNWPFSGLDGVVSVRVNSKTVKRVIVIRAIRLIRCLARRLQLKHHATRASSMRYEP